MKHDFVWSIKWSWRGTQRRDTIDCNESQLFLKFLNNPNVKTNLLIIFISSEKIRSLDNYVRVTNTFRRSAALQDQAIKLDAERHLRNVRWTSELLQLCQQTQPPTVLTFDVSWKLVLGSDHVILHSSRSRKKKKIWPWCLNYWLHIELEFPRRQDQHTFLGWLTFTRCNLTSQIKLK